MTSTQKRVFAILVFISIAYFTVSIFPNNTGAKDQMMISLFKPDEFAQYPVVMKMFKPGETLSRTVFNFIAYDHYYYSSPFYFSSTLLLLPIKLTENLRNTTQLNMLLLCQFISILSMLGALLLFTYTQTKFTSYAKPFALFISLCSRFQPWWKITCGDMWRGSNRTLHLLIAIWALPPGLQVSRTIG